MYILGVQRRRADLLLWCADLSVQGPKTESLFSCSSTTVDPCSSRQQSTFLFKNFSFFLSSIPPLLSNTYPTFFCPSCPLARSEVETCVSLHLHGRERKKSEVRSLPPPFLRPPLPSLPAEESRQTGAEHGTFINPRQIAKNPLHTRWLCLQRGECGRQMTLLNRRVSDFLPSGALEIPCF